jgi:hypothetical protein
VLELEVLTSVAVVPKMVAMELYMMRSEMGCLAQVQGEAGGQLLGKLVLLHE